MTIVSCTVESGVLAVPPGICDTAAVDFFAEVVMNSEIFTAKKKQIFVLVQLLLQLFACTSVQSWES